MANGTLTLNPVPNPQAGAAFTITGTLAVTPSMSFADDGGAAHAVTVAKVSEPISVNHPGLPVGTHQVTVTDSATGASAVATVTVVAASNVVFIGANQSFTDAAGNKFRMDAAENAYETPKGKTEVGIGQYGDIGWNAKQMAYDGTAVYIQDARDSTWHTFNPTTHVYSGAVAAPTGSNPPPPPGAPPQAAAVGYNTRTYGPDVTLGTNWFPFAGANLTQNADGSITDHGAVPNTWNAHFTPAIGSTGDSSGNIVGCIFDGGGYFEATISWANPPAESYQNPDGSHSDGWPAFWSVTGAHDFTDAMTDLPNRQNLELDTYEAYDPTDNSFFNCGIIHWYTDQTGVEYDNNTAGISPTAHAPAGVDVTKPHKIGFLWVPATATSQGYVKTYYDGVEAGPTYTWNQWTGGNVPGQDVPPFSAMDVGGRRILLGTGSKNPLTLHAFEVWQKDASKNKGTKA